MEKVVTKMRDFWKNKRILITGHTGFKGGWLSILLSRLGCEVHGYSLEPTTTPALFAETGLANRIHSKLADVGDLSELKKTLTEVQPDIVFHLAAKALVPQSYRDPVDTYATNVIGTVNMLESLRECPSVKAAVMITSDKVYENRDEPSQSFAEEDRLGGYDPYSASKACAELVVQSYRRSFFSDTGLAVATVRAGNVIGGGDWSPGRIMPDFFRAASAEEPLSIRKPAAVRPWQHVLDALSGYLLLAQRLHEQGQAFAEAWNFGPDNSSAVSVQEVVQLAADLWPTSVACRFSPVDANLHEAMLLALDCAKAHQRLHWRPRWNLHQAVEATVAWYRDFYQGQDPWQLCCQQIDQYLREDS
jgi:CDP-glucose 4,6-dehydratase